ncbi:MAG: hypothetical protein ABL949_17145 [Fimbriimonadaceae bacterium]
MRAIAEGRPTVRKKPAKVCVNAEFVVADETKPKGNNRHSDAFSSKLQGYEQKSDIRPVRWVSQPTMTKPNSFKRTGKSGACAAKVSRFIQGRLHAEVRE